jgi:hypothetical protein
VLSDHGVETVLKMEWRPNVYFDGRKMHPLWVVVTDDCQLEEGFVNLVLGGIRHGDLKCLGIESRFKIVGNPLTPLTSAL